MQIDKEKNRTIIRIVIIIICFSILIATIILLRSSRSQRKCLRVMAADALARSFGHIVKEFEEKYPDIDVILETQGSVIITRLVPLRRCDVLAVADYRLIEKMLAPKEASWVVKFASTEIVLAFTDMSKYKDEINENNWFDIILRKDVEYAYAAPSQDPCGYFTRLCWKLAESYYKFKNKNRKLYDELVNSCRKSNVMNDALIVLSILQAPGGLDYAFAYSAHAEDLNLPHITLPKKINLGYPSLEQHYNKCQVNVPNFRGGIETMVGTYIGFGITIPRGAENKESAELFVKFVLSDQGKEILLKSDFQIIEPPVVPMWCEQVPGFLKDIVVSNKK